MTSTQREIEVSYDVSNEFFKLWLDEDMHYTSASYKTGDETLEQAQMMRPIRSHPNPRVRHARQGLQVQQERPSQAVRHVPTALPRVAARLAVTVRLPADHLAAA